MSPKDSDLRRVMRVITQPGVTPVPDLYSCFRCANPSRTAVLWSWQGLHNPLHLPGLKNSSTPYFATICLALIGKWSATVLA